MIRPDRLVKFSEAEFQLKIKGLYTIAIGLPTRSISSEPNISSKAKDTSDSESSIIRRSISSFDNSYV